MKKSLSCLLVVSRDSNNQTAHGWHFTKIGHTKNKDYIRGHSTTMWTKFYAILTRTLLEWTKMDIEHYIYPLSHKLPWLSTETIPLFLST